MFISMSVLGEYDLFGGNSSFANHLFRYAALKIYALKNGLEVEVPENWIGRELFEGCDDPPISEKPRKQIDIGENKDCIWLNGELLEDCNLKGYFQYHTSLYAPYKEYFRKLFTPKQGLRDRVAPTFDKLTGTLIGIHIRRGDYCRPPNRVAPNEWYLDWLEKNWERFDNPTLYIASDDPESVISDFKKYNPRMCKPNTEAMSTFLDHYILQHCDVLLTSNSTFSFTAAMLNEKGKEFYRPDYQEKRLTAFDPWDSDPISPFPHHVKSAVRLHLGCGRKRLPGYINIDCMATEATDQICDIKKLPYNDNTVDTIECYHAFEHIPVCLHANIESGYGEKYASLIAVLQEWKRVLKPEGNLVIEMPDLDGVMREYLESPESRREELLISIYGSYRAYDDIDIHRWGANKARLTYLLEKAEFRFIKFCEATDYHKEIAPCLRVEAIK